MVSLACTNATHISRSDGLGVGVMAEIARVLVERDQHITGGVIFLFNGAEGECRGHRYLSAVC